MNSLFDQNNQEPTLDQSKNYLEELVGDGKKFKTVEELARGKAEADLYIKTVNQRADQLRNDYLQLRDQLNARENEEAAQAKFEDLLARYETARNNPQLPADLPERKPTQQLDETKLKSLIRDEFHQTQAEMKADANFNSVQNKLKEQFGDKYASVLQEKMHSLGLDASDVDTLARKSPTAFFNTLGLNQQAPESLANPPRSSRTTGFTPTGGEKRTWSYYENMRKTKPKLYYDPKIANQMHDDAIALGEAFQDGNFHA